MIFNPNQIQELLSIVENYHIVFVAENVGADFLSAEDKTQLKNIGVDIDSLIAGNDYISQAFKFGILSDALSDKRAKEMKYAEFKKFIQSGKFIPLNRREKDVIHSIKTQSLSDIRGLQGKIQGDIGNMIQGQESLQRADYERIIREAAIKTVEDRKGVKNMVSEIGHASLRWGRDFDRISEFVLHTAFDEGRASSIQRRVGEGNPASVYKIPYGGACKHCIRLYLTEGLGSKPIVFELSAITANGNNIGRKVDEWKAVVGPTHPYCRCMLEQIRAGEVWNEETKRFELSTAGFKRKVARKSDMKIVVGGKTTVI